uniref:Transposase MuDR plant domain-containing protein n=1 Tax=Lactuca sativa TaxID=4236 RepID=A0A9R1USX8_LACSA|nr:hypothetical protein LSAT_V11C800415230 [Lactuca sativa]
MDINCVLKKNDRTRLLVRCSKGACTFRLWASWMSDEESFQIKSLKVDHNYARNFKFGSFDICMDWESLYQRDCTKLENKCKEA